MGFVGDWFGKGGSSAAPPMPEMAPAPDFSGEIAGMMGMMSEMMGGMMEGMASSMEAANMDSALPDIYRDPVIDWSEKQEQLRQKASAEYSLDQVRRKGRTDTVLTSPLLDDEEADVTGSILTGEG